MQTKCFSTQEEHNKKKKKKKLKTKERKDKTDGDIESEWMIKIEIIKGKQRRDRQT